MDWGSLEPLAHSHSVEVSINPDGEATFAFNDIMLPDSNVNEAASHGYIKYRIDLIEDLPTGAVIENRADIYFDLNPAILTNTTVNTLYNCEDLLSTLDISTSAACYGTTVEGDFPSVVDFTNIVWTIDEEETTGTNFEWVGETAGTHDLHIELSTIHCSAETTVPITVLEEIPVTVVEPVSICFGDSVLVFDTYQSEPGMYYDSLLTEVDGCDSIISLELIVNDLPVVEFSDLEDDLICIDDAVVTLNATPDGGDFAGEGVSGAEFNPAVAGEGLHTLYYAYEDGEGCGAIDSVEISVTDCLGTEELESVRISVSPNPFTNYTVVNFGQIPAKNYVVIIHNTLGQEIYKNENVNGQTLEINSKELTTGTYILSVFNAQFEKEFTTKLIMN